MIAYRPARPDGEDRKFVVSSWCAAMKRAESRNNHIRKTQFYSLMWGEYCYYLDLPTVRTVIACDGSDADNYAGWCAAVVGVPVPLVLFCYVKEPLRRGGICYRLLAEVGIDRAKPFELMCSTAAFRRIKDSFPLARHNSERITYT